MCGIRWYGRREAGPPLALYDGAGWVTLCLFSRDLPGSGRLERSLCRFIAPCCQLCEDQGVPASFCIWSSSSCSDMVLMSVSMSVET